MTPDLSRSPPSSPSRDCAWPTIRDASGTELLDHYSEVLRKLSKTQGIIGDVYTEAQSRFTKPVGLKTLVTLIDETERTALDVDVKAAVYEGLLEKAAAEGKTGAGQHFTPRVLIQAIVQCMKPDPRTKPDFTVCDPAVGSGGFLVYAYEWLARGPRTRRIRAAGAWLALRCATRPRRARSPTGGS